MLLMLTAALADPVSTVAAMFPSASITEVGGKRAIAPVIRKGEVGYIDASRVSSVELDAGRQLIAFELQTIAEVEHNLPALEKANAGGPTRWRQVLAVVLVDAKGQFVAKPEGYPLEKVIDRACLGDFCDFGPRGQLLPVAESTRFAILAIDANPESMGSIVPLAVAGDVVVAHPGQPAGSAGGLSGCTRIQQFADYKERKGALRAGRMRSCEGDAEMCASECGDFPLERTLGPVTLAE